MLKIKILPAMVLFVCVGLGGFMIGGLCLLYALKNDSALAQGLPYSKSAQHALAYAPRELSLARQTLADGLRKLYESNQDGGFTCYESSDGSFTCMKPA